MEAQDCREEVTEGGGAFEFGGITESGEDFSIIVEEAKFLTRSTEVGNNGAVWKGAEIGVRSGTSRVVGMQENTEVPAFFVFRADPMETTNAKCLFSLFPPTLFRVDEMFGKFGVFPTSLLVGRVILEERCQRCDRRTFGEDVKSFLLRISKVDILFMFKVDGKCNNGGVSTCNIVAKDTEACFIRGIGAEIRKVRDFVDVLGI